MKLIAALFIILFIFILNAYTEETNEEVSVQSEKGFHVEISLNATYTMMLYEEIQHFIGPTAEMIFYFNNFGIGIYGGVLFAGYYYDYYDYFMDEYTSYYENEIVCPIQVSLNYDLNIKKGRIIDLSMPIIVRGGIYIPLDAMIPIPAGNILTGLKLNIKNRIGFKVLVGTGFRGNLVAEIGIYR